MNRTQEKTREIKPYKYRTAQILPDSTYKITTSKNTNTNKERTLTYNSSKYVNLNNYKANVIEMIRPSPQRTPPTIKTESITITRPHAQITIQYDEKLKELYIFDDNKRNNLQIIQTPKATYTNINLKKETLDSIIVKYKQLFNGHKNKLIGQETTQKYN